MGEHAATVDDMAAELAAVLQVQGNKGRSEWSKLHRKLAQVAAGAGGDDPTRAVKALLDVAKDASSSQALMRALQERVSKANLKNLVSLVAHELDMTPLGDSEPVHMVDEHSNFCKESVDRIVNCSAELSAPDAPYAVISIVGAQSSGKSFLMNRLFGTRFAEMDSQGRRCQTTRGIMMSRCIEPSLILLDVEGFDGKERKQDTLFEKQAALFALTVSDLMMVNIPKTSIGLEQGGANPLFRTIFQERTKLPKGITKLLVVLRYYDGEPSLEIMRTQVLESLEEIWISVNNESEKLKDYIEVNVVGLPDKHWPQFPKEVTVLRKLLSNNRSSKYTASSFSVSSSWFWDTIKKNKKLDILSHQVALAKLFCREEANNIVKSVKSQEKYKLMSKEDPRRFKEISHELLEEMKNKYDLITKMYDPDVRDNERQYMVERLHESIKDLSKELIRKVYENTIEQFKHKFDGEKIQNMKDADAFFQIMKDEQSKYVREFTSTFKDLKLVDRDHLQNTPEELKKKLEAHADQTIKIIKDHSRELIRMAQGHTLQTFKHKFDGKKLKKMKKGAKASISKCVDEFMSSFKDSKLVDSKYLQNIREELEKNLEAHADKKIKERERKAQEQWLRAQLVVDVTYAVVATTATTAAGKLVHSAVQLYNHDAEIAAQKQSQDDHCD